MRVLLDTKVLLQYLAGDAALSPRARTILQDPANRLVVSHVSLLEIALKSKTGRVELGVNFDEWMYLHILPHDWQVLPITPEQIIRLANASTWHGDFLEVLLAVQAAHENLAILTASPVYKHYPIEVLW